MGVHDDPTHPPQRRAQDPRIEQLVVDVAKARVKQEAMQRSLDENTQITTQMKGTVDDVRDILTSFKMLGKFAKWAGGIVAALATAWAAVKGIRG